MFFLKYIILLCFICVFRQTSSYDPYSSLHYSDSIDRYDGHYNYYYPLFDNQEEPSQQSNVRGETLLAMGSDLVETKNANNPKQVDDKTLWRNHANQNTQENIAPYFPHIKFRNDKDLLQVTSDSAHVEDILNRFRSNITSGDDGGGSKDGVSSIDSHISKVEPGDSGIESGYTSHLEEKSQKGGVPSENSDNGKLSKGASDTLKTTNTDNIHSSKSLHSKDKIKADFNTIKGDVSGIEHNQHWGYGNDFFYRPPSFLHSIMFMKQQKMRKKFPMFGVYSNYPRYQYPSYPMVPVDEQYQIPLADIGQEYYSPLVSNFAGIPIEQIHTHGSAMKPEHVSPSETGGSPTKEENLSVQSTMLGMPKNDGKLDTAHTLNAGTPHQQHAPQYPVTCCKLVYPHKTQHELHHGGLHNIDLGCVPYHAIYPKPPLVLRLLKKPLFFG